MKRAIVASIVILICGTPWLFLYSQASKPKNEEMVDLQRQVAANKKAIDDNHAHRGTSDATKLQFLDSILSALPTIIAALGAASLVIWNARKDAAQSSVKSIERNAVLITKTDAIEKKTEAIEKTAVEAREQTDKLITKTERIETLADGTLSKTTAKLDTALTEISGLKTLVASLLEREKIELAKQSMPPQRQELVDANGESTKKKPETAETPPLLDPQGTRIEKTGDDTNKTVHNVETHVEGRVDEVEAKLDEKKDKENLP